MKFPLNFEVFQSCFRTTTTTNSTSHNSTPKSSIKTAIQQAPQAPPISTIHCFKESSKPSYKPRKVNTSIEFPFEFPVDFRTFRETAYSLTITATGALDSPIAYNRVYQALYYSLLHPRKPPVEAEASNLSSLNFRLLTSNFLVEASIH